MFLSITFSPHALKSKQEPQKSTKYHEKNQWVDQTEVSDGCSSAAEEDTVPAELSYMTPTTSNPSLDWCQSITSVGYSSHWNRLPRVLQSLLFGGIQNSPGCDPLQLLGETALAEGLD